MYLQHIKVLNEVIFTSSQLHIESSSCQVMC